MSHFVLPDAHCNNRLSDFVIPDALLMASAICNKLLSHFLIPDALFNKFLPHFVSLFSASFCVKALSLCNTNFLNYHAKILKKIYCVNQLLCEQGNSAQPTDVMTFSHIITWQIKDVIAWISRRLQPSKIVGMHTRRRGQYSMTQSCSYSLKTCVDRWYFILQVTWSLIMLYSDK